jgi:hypothetical protein
MVELTTVVNWPASPPRQPQALRFTDGTAQTPVARFCEFVYPTCVGATAEETETFTPPWPVLKTTNEV